jgi:hypothetical protein
LTYREVKELCIAVGLNINAVFVDKSALVVPLVLLLVRASLVVLLVPRSTSQAHFATRVLPYTVETKNVSSVNLFFWKGQSHVKFPLNLKAVRNNVCYRPELKCFAGM